MFGSLTSFDAFHSLVLTNAITICKRIIKRADYLCFQSVWFSSFQTAFKNIGNNETFVFMES